MRNVTLIIICFAFILSPLRTTESNVISSKSIDYWHNYLYKGLNEYRSILYPKESSNNPNAVGLNHYRGLGQIGKRAAKDANVPYDSLFIPRWNDSATVRIMRVNWKYLGDYQKHVGDTIKGIKITQAGLLAGCHLRGHIYVKIWLKSNGDIDAKDANGVPVSSYIKLMENVKLIKY